MFSQSRLLVKTYTKLDKGRKDSRFRKAESEQETFSPFYCTTEYLVCQMCTYCIISWRKRAYKLLYYRLRIQAFPFCARASTQLILRDSNSNKDTVSVGGTDLTMESFLIKLLKRVKHWGSGQSGHLWVWGQPGGLMHSEFQASHGYIVTFHL